MSASPPSLEDEPRTPLSLIDRIEKKIFSFLLLISLPEEGVREFVSISLEKENKVFFEYAQSHPAFTLEQVCESTKMPKHKVKYLLDRLRGTGVLDCVNTVVSYTKPRNLYAFMGTSEFDIKKAWDSHRASIKDSTPISLEDAQARANIELVASQLISAYRIHDTGRNSVPHREAWALFRKHGVGFRWREVEALLNKRNCYIEG